MSCLLLDLKNYFLPYPAILDLKAFATVNWLHNRTDDINGGPSPGPWAIPQPIPIGTAAGVKTASRRPM